MEQGFVLTEDGRADLLNATTTIERLAELKASILSGTPMVVLEQAVTLGSS